jgi:hypothetical protein
MAVKMTGRKVLKAGLPAVLGQKKGGNLARDLLFGHAEIRNGKSARLGVGIEP